MRYYVEGETANGANGPRFEFDAEPVQGDTIADVLSAYILGFHGGMFGTVRITKAAPVRYDRSGCVKLYSKEKPPTLEVKTKGQN